MNKLFTNFLLTLLFLLVSLQLWAQAPAGYYNPAKGKNAKTLLIALHEIIGEHTNVGYDGLWNVYATSDVRSDGTIWDMYSTSKFVLGKGACGNYKYVGDCYNREHSFPKSWFDDASPMYSDAFHIYPTDGKVNGQRSNYPYGETANGTTLPSHNGVNALGKLGACTFPGYTGIVFEPIDEYKGDFARTYFYMASCYQDKISNWGGGMTNGTDYPCYKDWVINMLLKWHRQDPVSEKETNRNNAVYKYQHNRNPFIDYPELAEYIWGDNTNTGWTPGGVVKPILITPVEGQHIDMGITAVGRDLSYEIQVKGQGLTENLNVSVLGIGFTSTISSLSKEAVMNGTILKVDYRSATVSKGNATLKLSNKDLTVSLTLSAEAVDGIPARQASNIGFDSFTAEWVNVDGAGVNYRLSVWDIDKNAPVFSQEIPAGKGKQEVKELKFETDYHYQLSYNGKVSNVIDVKTLAPVPVLSLIVPEDGLNFYTVPGTVSEMKGVEVYTEYVNEDIIAQIDAPFEISLDKSEWKQTLSVDAVGESFYVRLSASAAAGRHVGTLSLRTSTIDGDEVDVEGTASLPVAFLEDFEEAKVGGYYTKKEVECTMGTWVMNDVGVWPDIVGFGNSARFGKTSISSMEMADAKQNGASSLSFYAAVFGGDTDATIEVFYSTQQSASDSWLKLGSEVISNTTPKQYTYALNIGGPIIIKIQQIAGKRLNIDNIAMTDYVPVSIIQTTGQNWDAYVQQGKLVLEMDKARLVKVFSANAVTMYQQEVSEGLTRIPLPEGMYIVVCDERAKKVIVK